MDFKKALVILGLSFTLVQCSTGAKKTSDADVSGLPVDVTADADKIQSDLPSPAQETPPPAPEPSEGVPQNDAAVNAQGGEKSQKNVTEKPANKFVLKKEEASPSDMGGTAPSTMTGLDFLANENGGTIVIKTNHEVRYSTRRNDRNNQYIVELMNTSVPKKFQRALVTKEFPGIIGSVQAYQSRGGENITRVIVQLKGPMDPASEPGVSQSGNVIKIAAAGSTASEGNDDSPAKSSERTARSRHKKSGPNSMSLEGDSVSAEDLDEGGDTATTSSRPVDDMDGSDIDARIMNNKSFDSFLLGRTKYYGNPISIEVNNQDVREVFKFISDESGLNIILDEDVKGHVTMKLRKVPWDQALAIVLQSNQLGYVKSGSILRVATLKTLQSETATARHVIDSQKDLEPIRVQVFPMSYSKADDVVSQVQALISTRGKVSADKRTNTLVVADIAEVLGKVRALVNKLDTQTPQVLIEAKIAEITDDFSKQFGINWNSGGIAPALSPPFNIASATTPISGAGQALVGTGGYGGGDINGLTQYASAYNPQANNTLGIGISNLDLLGNLTATLQMAESNNLAHLISSPKIVAVDRVEATINQITEYPYATTTIVNGVTTVTPLFKDVKLELKVTPQITADGGILMAVGIERDLIGAQINTGAGIVPSVDTRKATTQVLVENGDTVMIGGIYQSDAHDIEAGVPFLKDIPIIGFLFKSKQHTNTKNELVVFITPKILNREKAFVKAGESM